MTSGAPACEVDADTQPGFPGEVRGLDLDLDLGATGSSEPALGGQDATVPLAWGRGVASELVTDIQAYSHTQPMAPVPLGLLNWRVLVASSDENERMYLRARLALANLVKVDDALSTTQAVTALAAREYTLVFVNDDSVSIDPSAVAAAFRAGNRLGSLVVTTSSLDGRHPFDLLARWRKRKLRQHFGDARFTHLVGKPLSPSDVQEVLREWAQTHVQ